MEPRIQYAKTSDGVSIAFSTMGEGMPFVEMPAAPWTHVQAAMQIPAWRSWTERLAEKMNHVWFDARGSGLSRRDISGVSLDDLVLDLEAVVDRLGLERFALFGHHTTAAAAMAFAARQPDRVSHLVLWCPFARGSDFTDGPKTRALRTLLEDDYETYVETLMHVGFGWAEGEAAHRAALSMREWVTPSMGRVYWKMMSEVDVTDILPNVVAPTLVLQRRQYVTLESAMDLASRLPNAQMVLLEGTSGATYVEDMEAVVNAIEEFVGVSEEAQTGAGRLSPEDVHTILFTDVEGSTALTDRLGDAKARDLLREHEGMVREALKSHGGSEVKTMGDGFMASFSSATKALECAIALQRAFAQRNESAEEPILVRVGLNAGEPIAEDDPGGRGDLFGTAVNMAARIASKAEGGEVLVADVVRQLVAGKEFLFADRGDTELRGFEDPVRVYEVQWRD
ncbi:MAG TPA: adenylate/guanylate cyclase domain-containing protein [Dehalococcoidia bacterium]